MSNAAASMMMQNLILDFPKHIKIALDLSARVALDKPDFDFKNVLILGMGGSGIGGVLVRNWISDDITIPVFCVHDYSIPAFVDDETLVIASSYSGNTEETLMALSQAQDNGAYIIGICSGGKLEAFCKEYKYPLLMVPGGNPPRTALGFSLVMLLTIFEKMELVTNRYSAMIQTAAQNVEHELESIQAQANDLAKFLSKRIPIFYATSHFEGVAVRARQQINENAKTLCWHHLVPEMNHNELVGWTGGNERYAPVFLLSQHELDRNLLRIQLSKDEMAARNCDTFTLKALGENKVEEAIYLIHIIDWASYYLSEMNDVDPIAIPAITLLKSELERFANE